MMRYCNERVAVLAAIGDLLDSEFLNTTEARECILFACQSDTNVAILTDLLEARKEMPKSQALFLRLFLFPDIQSPPAPTPIVPTTFFGASDCWDVNSSDEHLQQRGSPLIRRPTAIRPVYTINNDGTDYYQTPHENAAVAVGLSSLTRETTSCSHHTISSVSPKYGPNKNLLTSHFSPDGTLNA